MRSAGLGCIVGIALLAGPRPVAADHAVHGDRFDIVLPDGFRPTAGTFARDAAAPLRELLGALGAEAYGARRIRCDLLGAPAEPDATFVARTFVLRPPEADVLGRITDAQLASGWKRFTAARKDHVPTPTGHRTVGGIPSHELGGYDPLPSGEIRWTRYLLVHRTDEVWVFGFTATAPDPKAADATWERLVAGLRIELPQPADGLLQGIATGTALGALLMAGVLALLRRRRARRVAAASVAPVVRHPPTRPMAPSASRVARADRAPSAPETDRALREPLAGPTVLEGALARRLSSSRP